MDRKSTSREGKPERERSSPDSMRGENDSVQADDGFDLSAEEERDVDRKLPPSVQVLHEIIRAQGEIELGRSVAALGWSALAAGLTMGFSMLVPALLAARLPPTPASYLISTFGYSVGFLIVILARQQLFTENTMTAVLPMMTDPSWRAFGRLLRLWGVVMLGNLIGVALFAYGCMRLPLFDAPTHDLLIASGNHLMLNTTLQMFVKGTVAGWLIATMVWLVPSSDHAKLGVIVLMTYIVGLGGFTHIVVGSTEALVLVFSDKLLFVDYLLKFALPTLAGNIVGGSLIFALISHVQVRSDDSRRKPEPTRQRNDKRRAHSNHSSDNEK